MRSVANTVEKILAASKDVADFFLFVFLATGFGRHNAGERKAKPRIEFITFPGLPEDNYSSGETPQAIAHSGVRGRRTSPGTW